MKTPDPNLPDQIPAGAFFVDWRGNVPPQFGVRGFNPCLRVESAAREVERTVGLAAVKTPFQTSLEQPLVEPAIGLEGVPNGWEYPGFFKAWRNHGPVQLVGVVVDKYTKPRPSARASLTKLGRFLFHLVENFQRA